MSSLSSDEQMKWYMYYAITDCWFGNPRKYLPLTVYVPFIQEVFHVYLNKFENAVTHLFLIIMGIIDFHGLIWSPEIRSHQEISS